MTLIPFHVRIDFTCSNFTFDLKVGRILMVNRRCCDYNIWPNCPAVANQCTEFVGHYKILLYSVGHSFNLNRVFLNNNMWIRIVCELRRKVHPLFILPAPCFGKCALETSLWPQRLGDCTPPLWPPCSLPFGEPKPSVFLVRDGKHGAICAVVLLHCIQNKQ